MAPGRKVPAVLYLSNDDERQDVSVTRESKKERYQFKARLRYYPSGAQGPPQQDSGQEPSQFKATPRYRARLFLLCWAVILWGHSKYSWAWRYFISRVGDFAFRRSRSVEAIGEYLYSVLSCYLLQSALKGCYKIVLSSYMYISEKYLVL